MSLLLLKKKIQEKIDIIGNPSFGSENYHVKESYARVLRWIDELEKEGGDFICECCQNIIDSKDKGSDDLCGHCFRWNKATNWSGRSEAEIREQIDKLRGELRGLALYGNNPSGEKATRFAISQLELVLSPSEKKEPVSASRRPGVGVSSTDLVVDHTNSSSSNLENRIVSSKQSMACLSCDSTSFYFDGALNAYCEKCGRFYKARVSSAPKEKCDAIGCENLVGERSNGFYLCEEHIRPKEVSREEKTYCESPGCGELSIGTVQKKWLCQQHWIIEKSKVYSQEEVSREEKPMVEYERGYREALRGRDNYFTLSELADLMEKVWMHDSFRGWCRLEFRDPNFASSLYIFFQQKPKLVERIRKGGN